MSRVATPASYVGADGRERVCSSCETCHGEGRLDYRGQRRVGLSARFDDPPMPCPACKGSGYLWRIIR